MTRETESAWKNWPLDREIVISRVIDAPRRLVWQAWADPEQIGAWFGPEGLAIETKEIDLRAGGIWRFDMVGEGDLRFTNRMRFLRMEEERLIEVLHGSDEDGDPAAFRMLVTFDEQENGKTVITLRQMHPDAARRAEVIGFGAVEYGGQTLAKLAAHVAKHSG
ncbi:SRPBCC family protein [Maritimibacter sp. DP1N21-5]|uniref:SRPBCC family protein n=1 Tax=Maritimibacter sp. DP1N21-5 TaxID=2836867 RepID=UPI001C48D2D2|nr:SRPBCC family protein [Maritimibacter sp. DP1N21-5]MBV7409570.1 SRPBCC family protein [Maritimibacter sp. DP1N21-5]